jgi:DNA-binding NarL/FixJ family response regulator
MELIKILIADDHQMFRDGLKSLLEKESNIEIVGEAENGQEVLDFVKDHEVNLVLMDINMDGMNGIEATQQLKKNHPNTQVLVLSMHSETSYILTMLDAGAKGYILKNAGRDEMIRAIKVVAEGNTYYSSQVSNKIIEQLSAKKKVKKLSSSIQDMPLTEREIEVLLLISQEYSNPEIAEKLFISIRTVDTHRRNLLDKLGVKNTAGLVKYAIKKGLID